MKIAGRVIGRSTRPYIIAEISANHMGELDRALKLVDAAKEAGASAVKFQYYDPDRLARARGRRVTTLRDGLWAGQTLTDVYRAGATPLVWFETLSQRCVDLRLPWGVSVFDPGDVAIMDGYAPDFFKVASLELGRHDVIEAMARRGRPLIMSTGVSDMDEIGYAVRTALETGTMDVALMHCVSAYPCPTASANLGRINQLDYRFGTTVGWSDHTIGNVSAIAAIARGACIIEKHLTLDRDDPTLDAAFSAEPWSFADLVSVANDAWAACFDNTQIQPYADLKAAS